MPCLIYGGMAALYSENFNLRIMSDSKHLQLHRNMLSSLRLDKTVLAQKNLLGKIFHTFRAYHHY
jgi:hypothetical protein